MVFPAWRGLDSAADIDAVGPHLLDGLRDIPRSQSSGQENTRHRGRFSSQRPIGHLSRAAIGVG